MRRFIFSKNGLSIGLIIGLTMIALLIWDKKPNDLLKFEHNTVSQQLNIPYAVIANAHSQYFDQSGKLTYSFTSEKMRHFRTDFTSYKNDDFMLIEKPSLTLFSNDNKAPWYLNAKEGKVTNKGKRLTLSQDVTIWQENSYKTQLSTTELTFEPEAKIISTDAHVVLKSRTGKLEADGMIIDINDKKITLLNNVTGYHEPETDLLLQ